ncbi:MAG: hypothetical protein ACXVDK_17635 [Bacteroidia bacterium]
MSSIFLIAGPFLLICGVSMGYMQTSLTGISRGIFTGRGFSNLYLELSVALFFAFVGQVVLNSVVYNYMLLYNSKSPGEPITVAEVGRSVLSNVGKLLGAVLSLTLIIIVIGVVISFVFIGIGGSLGIFGGVIIGLAIFAAIMIYAPILMYLFPSALFVVVRDGDTVFNGWGKAVKYLKGNFWWTWLIMVVALVSFYIVNLVFTLPATIVAMVCIFTRASGQDYSGDDRSLWLILLYTFGLFMSYCLSSFLLVLCAFNFLGHEEKNEGNSLFSKIEEIK